MKEAFEFLKNNYKTILIILLVIGIIVSIIISLVKSSKEEETKKKSLFVEEEKQAKSLKTYANSFVTYKSLTQNYNSVLYDNNGEMFIESKVVHSLLTIKSVINKIIDALKNKDYQVCSLLSGNFRAIFKTNGEVIGYTKVFSSVDELDNELLAKSVIDFKQIESVIKTDNITEYNKKIDKKVKFNKKKWQITTESDKNYYEFISTDNTSKLKSLPVDKKEIKKLNKELFDALITGNIYINSTTPSYYTLYDESSNLMSISDNYTDLNELKINIDLIYNEL